MSREFISFDEAQPIETDLGIVWVTAVDKDTLSLDANSSGKSLEFRGVKYCIHCHATVSGNEFKLMNRPHISRKVFDKNYNKPASDTATKKILEACLFAANEFVNRFPALADRAGKASNNNVLFYLERDVSEARDNLRGLLDKLHNAKASEATQDCVAQACDKLTIAIEHI